ncbi:MAG: hypothetical protein CfClM3_1735 [Methanobrevibacter sp. CfCl-M3]
MNEKIPLNFTDSKATINYNITKENEIDKGVQVTLLETNYLNYPDNKAPLEKHYSNKKDKYINSVNWSKVPTKMRMDVDVGDNSATARFTVLDNRWDTDSILRPISDGEYNLSITFMDKVTPYPSTPFTGGVSQPLVFDVPGRGVPVPFGTVMTNVATGTFLGNYKYKPISDVYTVQTYLSRFLRL